MRRRVTLPLLTVATVGASLFVAVAPAAAHGYISSPPSRQANCARGAVANCGDIVYEPQPHLGHFHVWHQPGDR